MKKYLCIIAAAFIATSLQAQHYGSERISLSLNGQYCYDRISHNYAGAEIRGFFPFGRYFEALCGVEFLSERVFSTAITSRGKLPIRRGEFFCDLSLSWRNFYRYSSEDLVGAFSAGYRMNYVSAQVGLFCRGMYGLDNSGNRSYVREDIDLLYRVSFKVKKATCRWNAGAGITNYDDYLYERMWQPMFYIDGWFNINDHFCATASVWLRPTGMFHLTASFYGITSKVGLTYRF